MSTTAIIIIAVVVLLLLAVLAATLLSGKARRERALKKERAHAATQHREQAQVRESEAERAEREAKERRREAERAEHRAKERRLAAEEHQERAELHEEGRADHELEHGPDQPQHTGAGADHTTHTGEAITPDRQHHADTGDRSGGTRNPLDRDDDGRLDRDDLKPHADDAGSRSVEREQPRERSRITDDVRDSGQR